MKMTKLLLLLVFLLVPAGFAHADLDAFLKDLNISAHADRSGFIAQLGARFHIGQADIDVLLSNVGSPADAAMVLWLGEVSHQSRDRVLQVYREKKSQGWGAVAKRLGIKPGSSEFHALKEGKLDFNPSGNEQANSEKHRGSGMGKEHGKGKGK